MHRPAKLNDPICGMTISLEKAVGEIDHDGHHWGFCSDFCSDTFSKDPDGFTKKAMESFPHFFKETVEPAGHEGCQCQHHHGAG